MVASKRILCFVCNKKCSGNVLRYQDRYYHKPCFESEQIISSSSPDQQQQYASNQGHSQQQQVSSIENNPRIGLNSNQNRNYNHAQPNSRGRNDLPLRSNQNLNNPYQTQQYQPSDRSHSPALPLVANKPVIETSSDRLNMREANSAIQQKSSLSRQTNRSHTIDYRSNTTTSQSSYQTHPAPKASSTLPHSTSSPANGFLNQATNGKVTCCAGCNEQIKDGQALIALDLHWHVRCFKCAHCQVPLHGEYVAKDGKAYCEKDYQKQFGVVCVYCKRYITGKVLQAGEAHHFHPSCARCSKCGDPFVPGEEMYLQGEVTWHPRCGPGPDSSGIGPLDDVDLDTSSRSQLRPSSRAKSSSLSSRSRSASPFSYISRQYGSPYADSEAVGDLSRVYTISYLSADPTQGYLRRPIEPNPPKSPQFSRPASLTRERSRSSSRSQYCLPRDRSVPRGMYSVLSGMRGSSSQRARSPSMMNEEAIQSAQYPSGQKPSPDTVPKIERDDFPAPPFPYSERSSQIGGGDQAAHSNGHTNNKVGDDLSNGLDAATSRKFAQSQERTSRPRSREIVLDDGEDSSGDGDPQLKKEEEELSKIANGIGKIFLQTLKEREKLRAWKRSNLDPRNASRTPSATRELPSKLRYDNPTAASPSRDLDHARPWDDDDDDQSPTRTRSSLGRHSQMAPSTYGYKVVQSNRSTPRPGYGLTNGPYGSGPQNYPASNHSTLQRRAPKSTLSRGASGAASSLGSSAAHLRRSMPNFNQLSTGSHLDAPPKLYPYHLLATTNYRLPPDVDRCHLERHLSNEEFLYIFNCDRLDFYRLPEWRRNELKRRAKLF